MEITIKNPTEAFTKIFDKLSKGFTVVEYQPDSSPDSVKTVEQLEKNCGDIGLQFIALSHHYYLIVNSDSVGYSSVS